MWGKKGPQQYQWSLELREIPGNNNIFTESRRQPSSEQHIYYAGYYQSGRKEELPCSALGPGGQHGYFYTCMCEHGKLKLKIEIDLTKEYTVNSNEFLKFDQSGVFGFWGYISRNIMFTVYSGILSSSA